MTKRDINEFDVVKTRDGKILILLTNSLAKEHFGLFSRETVGCRDYWENYNDDLTHNENRSKDIVAVCNRDKSYIYTVLEKFFADTSTKEHWFEHLWNWEREEIKEVTISDIEQQFGCKVKIIKEHN